MSVKNVISTSFADDFYIIWKNKVPHRKLVLDMEKKVRSMGLILKPSEFRALSMQKGTLTILNFNLNK